MRIISGIYKSRRFPIPANFRARPTTDFARENIFNVIHNLMDLQGTTALDLFSGTGSIGFELISRGCNQVVCVEKDAYHIAFIRKVKDELQADGLVIIKGDAWGYIKTCNLTFDFIFADPPYTMKELGNVPQFILSHNLLKPGGIFVMEHPTAYDFSAIKGFNQRRIYGAVNFSLFNHTL